MNDTGLPYGYEVYNEYSGSYSPSTVHTQNTALHRYYVRYLLQRAMSVFEWELPDIWQQKAKNYMLYVLYSIGFFAVIDTDKFGVIPQHCSLSGYDIFYQPAEVLINNPLIQDTLRKKIGIDCVLFKLQPDYGGIMDLVAYYADQLALMAEAVSVNAVNSKLSFLFGAKDKAQAESLKKMYDNYSTAQPAVFYDKNLLDPKTGELNVQFFNNNVRESYIISDLLNDIRTVMNDFDSQIGIPNANTQKKERMLTDEVNANNFETRSMCELWLESLQTSCEDVKAMFGVDMSVDWRTDLRTENIESEGDDNASKRNSDV